MRFATSVLIVLAGMIVADAQEIERPPSFYAPKRDVPNRPLFPQVPFDAKGLALPVRPTEQRIAPPIAASQPDPQPRSGSVCLKAVPVDPSSDRAFVVPIPDTGSLPIRIIEMPPCVTPGLQPRR